MRRTAMMVAMVAILVAAFSGAAFATSEPLSRFLGTAGDDSLRGTSKDDVIEGLGGNDALRGLGGDDFLYGNKGNDALYGGAGNDVMHGGDGDDRAEERAVHGGSGSDVLYGEAGEDALYGGPGGDIVISTGDGKADYVDCGGGVDAVRKGPDQGLDRFVNCEKFFR